MTDIPDFRRLLYSEYVTTHVAPDQDDKHFDRCEHEDWWRAKVLPLFTGLERTARILELGAGAGQFLRFLERSGFRNLSGIDISIEQAEIAQQHGIRVTHGDAFQLLAGGTSHYACIVGFDFFEHLTREELVAIMPLIRERLEPGGRLLIQTVNGAGLFPFQVAYGDLTHMTVLSEGSLRQLLRWAGMSNIQVFEAGPAANGWKGYLRLTAWKLIRGIAWTARFVETGKRQAIWTENLLCVAERPADNSG